MCVLELYTQDVMRSQKQRLSSAEGLFDCLYCGDDRQSPSRAPKEFKNHADGSSPHLMTFDGHA